MEAKNDMNRYEPTKEMSDDEFRWYMHEYEEWLDELDASIREQWFLDDRFLHTD